jgi:HTH-type transcriptional regulator / antitoxin HigA
MMNLSPKAMRSIAEALEFRIAAYQNQLDSEELSEDEYDRALAIAEPLVANRNLSNEESKFLSLIVTLIEDYEGKHYPLGDVSPHAALLHLMEYSGTSQTDLVGSIGSQEVVSEIVDAKRSIDPI